MAFVDIPSREFISSEKFSKEISDIFDDFKFKMGLPEAPNMLKVMSHSENVVKGSWALIENVLIKGATPRSVKEMLIMAISISRGCHYCQDSHSVISRMLGTDSDLHQDITNEKNQINPNIFRNILNFGIKCSKDPQSLTQGDFESLKQYNLSQSEIIEIISVVGLAVYFNIFVDATGIVPDKMFA